MVAIVAGAQTMVTPLPDGGWRVEKTGGLENDYAAAAASAAAIAGDFILKVTDLTPPNSVIFGVSANPSANDGFSEIDFSVQFHGGYFYVYERGTFVPPARMQDGTVWFTRTGGELSYHIGPTLAGSTLARSVGGVNGELWFDCSIARMGGAIGVRFEPDGDSDSARAPMRLRIGIGE